MPAYAVQRLFVHASRLTAAVSGAFAIPFLLYGEIRNASISAGIATVSFCYWMAFHERRDIGRR